MLASWASPQTVEDEAGFAAALAEAVQETRFSGQRVTVLLEHRNLLFHVQETPPVKGRLLKPLLERLVRQNRFFEEDVAWGHAPLPATKDRHRHLLALLPASLVNQLQSTCAGQKLQLAAVLPFAAVYRDELRHLGLPPEEIVVLAADCGNSLNLLLGRGDGQILFSRSVVLASTQKADRAAQEINRTLHYAQQQFGATVNQIFVVGDDAFAVLKDMQIRQGVKIQQCPAEEAPFTHARKGAVASPKLSLNLLSLARKKQQHLQRIAAAIVGALLVASAFIATKVELSVRASEQRMRTRAVQSGIQADNHSAFLDREREAEQLRALLHLAGTTNDPPVPELFVRHITSILPETVRLTQLTVNRATNGWTFNLEGFVTEQSAGTIQQSEQFEQTLTDGWFRAQITDSTRRRLFGGMANDGPTASRRGQNGEVEKAMFVSGIIQ